MKLEGHPLFVNNGVPLQVYCPSKASRHPCLPVNKVVVRVVRAIENLLLVILSVLRPPLPLHDADSGQRGVTRLEELYVRVLHRLVDGAEPKCKFAFRVVVVDVVD